MALTALQTLKTAGSEGGSTLLDRVQGLLATWTARLKNAVTNDVIIGPPKSKSDPAGIIVGAASVKVTHGLGHPPVSWEVVYKDANAVVWEDTTVAVANVDRTKWLWIKASGTATVWIRFT